MAYEKMRCRYDTERDLMDRLNGTVCRYDDKVVYVTVESKSQLRLYDNVTKKKSFLIKPSDPLFDISSPEIGYLNFKQRSPKNKDKPQQALYLQRNPVRRYRQGLFPESCGLFSTDGIPVGYGSSLVFSSQGLSDSIEGIFPSYREALDLLGKGETEVAVSRDIAMRKFLSGVVLVYCQCTNVAFITPGSSKAEMLEDDTSWVAKTMLKKAGVHVYG